MSVGAPPSPAGRSASKTRVDALMTRGSIILRKKFSKQMDGRVKPTAVRLDEFG
jgi:hypothetical protein